ncbi:MAG: nitroreductase family deazaflavin-dependent oxidoreductase [Thaumarchaeota archaeon]|nr:nitroreductase family deazaflavin-dependent oxidoreductase [Nitrososphaerota archaeon]MDE1843055.1 nitroreductase family deazaflavin-dependent oxidoreductase [Nitrososphaerota archaeon]
MDIKDGTFKAILVTTGRKTGKEHAVEIRAVFHNGKFYFSRRNPDSDWLKNARANLNVKIKYQEQVILGTALLVEDQQLCKKISQMKYSDKRSEESRIVLEVTPCEL